MKITISNIAWNEDSDIQMLSFLQEQKIQGLEIAPTRLIASEPYSDLERVVQCKKQISDQYQLQVVSMQSICYGRNEAIFNSVEERITLQRYMEKAIDFASVLGCRNLVFGSPKNRIIQSGQEAIARDYFSELGRYANDKKTVFAIEPNPEIYGTNFITSTKEAFEFVKSCDTTGLEVNVDLGTIINNKESLNILADNIALVSHVHISEPYLEKVKVSTLHHELAALLKQYSYPHYISIEMKSGVATEEIKDIILEIKDVFSHN